MSTNRYERVAEAVWSTYAQELGTDTTAAQLLPHACILRPALRALRLAQVFDDWSVVELPPRTFYALMAAAKLLRGDDIRVEEWSRDNEEGRAAPLSSAPRGLPWAQTLADVRNAAIVLGQVEDIDYSGLELLAETQHIEAVASAQEERGAPFRREGPPRRRRGNLCSLPTLE